MKSQPFIQFVEEDLLQPNSAEHLVVKELEGSFLSDEEEGDTQTAATTMDAGQSLIQVNQLL